MDERATPAEAENGTHISVRRLSLWLLLALSAAIVGCAALLASTSLEVIRQADRHSADTAQTLLGELQSVARIERLVALGDELVSASEPERWRAAGTAMQALAYHPSLAALDGRSEKIRATFDVAQEIVHHRQKDAPPQRLAELWSPQRAYLQTIADDTAVTAVQRTAGISASISETAHLILAASLGGSAVTLLAFLAIIALVRRHLLQPLLGISTYLGDLRRGIRDGQPLPVARSIEIAHICDAVRDLGETQQALRQMALYDPLTGLANRHALEVRLEQALADARRHDARLALLLIDLDHFKSINDTLGHAVGDDFLKEIAARILATVRDTDTVARLGGDEFVVTLNDISSPRTAAVVAAKLIQALGRPVRLGEQTLPSTASIGICVFPDDGGDRVALMKNADIAMYHAKSAGRNSAQFFDAAMNAAASERQTLERELREALDNGEFILHYQPQLCARSGRVEGVEALIRWQHRDGSLIPPNTFIPLAEETGLIMRIGEWVLGEACRTAQRWRTDGGAALAGLRMAVNLSAHQLTTEAVIGQVRHALAESGLPAACLELEITESVAMKKPEVTIDNLRALRQIGVELAIDDFGTGYSSLAYLKLFPLNRLKLDRTFVKDIETDANDATICATTIRLAHSLALEVVAEGVETEAQADYLRRQGCDVLQGFLFSRPRPADEAFAFILARHAAAGDSRAA